jgi:adenine-specific DNA methylase
MKSAQKGGKILERLRRFFKVSRILIITFVLSILGLILYFTYPIKIQNVLQHTDNIERIHVIYISNGNSSEFLVTKDQGINFDEVIKILGAITYTRKINTFRGGFGDVIIMAVVYREKDGVSNNYSVDIRELGIIISHEKEYRMNGDSKEIINKLVDWITSHESKLEDGTDSI